MSGSLPKLAGMGEGMMKGVRFVLPPLQRRVVWQAWQLVDKGGSRGEGALTNTTCGAKSHGAHAPIPQNVLWLHETGEQITFEIGTGNIRRQAFFHRGPDRALRKDSSCCRDWQPEWQKMKKCRLRPLHHPRRQGTHCPMRATVHHSPCLLWHPDNFGQLPG